MNRARWFVSAVAVAVSVALAGPAAATQHQIGPVPLRPSPAEKVKPSTKEKTTRKAVPGLGSILKVVKMELLGPDGTGCNDCFELKKAINTPGQYKVKVTYKNIGTASTVAKTATLSVWGGEYVHPQGWPYKKDFSASIPILAANATKSFEWDLGRLPVLPPPDGLYMLAGF